ncbi:MAG: TetR/AcrR family transcriptional regulator, partial [Actinomycetota bacterium]
MTEGVSRSTIDQEGNGMAGERRLQRREQIIDVAAECFAAANYADVPMEDIATRAGVTRMMLYRYFESKDDIYTAVLDRVAEAITLELASLQTPVTSDSVTRVHFAVAASNPAGYRLFWTRARSEPLFAGHTAALERRVHDVSAQLLAEWVDLGPMQSWAGEVATRFTVSAALTYLDAPDSGDPATVETFASE